MKPRPFAYGRDAVCVVAIALYAINRCVLEPLVGARCAFVHGYLGDVLCLPACLPLALGLQRRLGLRRHDLPPTPAELVLHWSLWSCCFEWLGPSLPLLAPGAVGDPFDALAYAAGGLVAAVLWRSRRAPANASPPAHRVARVGIAFGVALAVLAAYRAAAAFGAATGMRSAPA